jgi:hypothetical protein
MTVFDGFNALATLPEPGAAGAGAATRADVADGGHRADDSGAAREAAHDRAESSGTAQPASVEHGADLIEPAPEPPLALGPAAAQSDLNVVARPPVGGNVAAPEQTPDVSGEAQVVDLGQRDARPSSRAWAAGVAMLLTALAGQAAYAYRTELAVQYPGLKPILLKLCSALGCRVPLPQRPHLINIEASDLQVLDPVRPSVIQLTATLRNHAGHEVGFPALDLVLTDTKEHTLARRIFVPDEYLDSGRSGTGGLAANAEITVQVVLDTGSLGASGFRLALLAAPPQ